MAGHTLIKRKLIGYKDLSDKRETKLFLRVDRTWRSISGPILHSHYIKISLNQYKVSYFWHLRPEEMTWGPYFQLWSGMTISLRVFPLLSKYIQWLRAELLRQPWSKWPQMMKNNRTSPTWGRNARKLQNVKKSHLNILSAPSILTNKLILFF